MQNESLLHVREGYRAVYESADGGAVEVRAVRFDDATHMPTTLALPGQSGRAAGDQFAIGTIVVQVVATRETKCSHAIDAYLRDVK